MRYRILLAGGLLVILAGWLQGCAPRPSLSTYSLDHVYNEDAAVALAARRLDGGSYERIYLRLSFRNLAEGSSSVDVARRFRASYQVGAGYDGQGLFSQDTLQLERMHYLGSGHTYILTFNIQKPPQAAVMMIKVEDRVTRNPYIFDLPLPARAEVDGSDRFLVFNRSGARPLYGSFARPGDTVSLRTLTLADKPIYLRQYVLDFPPALPPMAVTTNVVAGVENPAPVARYVLQANAQLVLSSPGTFVLSEDTVRDPGQAIVVAPHKYPDLSRASELVAPLTYMTTRAERLKMATSKNVKLEVDRFWLAIASNNKDYARRLIAAYYSNVEYANAWFTDYREGWKTDRGMVFIIFGKPSQVLRTGPTEEWRYDERGVTPELRFVFERRAAPLGPQTWQLRRSSDYDKYWYAVVDQWRKGIIRR